MENLVDCTEDDIDISNVAIIRVGSGAEGWAKVDSEGWDSRLIKGRHNGGLIYFGSSYKHCQHDLADH